MKMNIKNITISIGMCVILVVVIVSEISIFISGPTHYYDHKVTSQIDIIKESYKDITDINRHVFSYIIYSGEMGQNVYWFNEQGQLLTQRKASEINKEKAKALAESEFGVVASEISLGYGYKNPVYVIEDEQAELYLDVDSMKQVFYRKKG